MSTFWDRHGNPRLICWACGQRALEDQRLKVVPLATGRVLELGFGGGLNLRFYDPVAVHEVVGIDPSPELRARAEQAPRPDGLTVRSHAGEAESLPFDNNSFDTVLSTFTMCSVRSVTQVLSEVTRVLKPSGSLLFCEHGLSPDPQVAAWQRGIEPFWKPLAGGCHLTRPVGSTITTSGFHVEQGERTYLRDTPRPFGWVEWGIARSSAF